MKPTLVLSLAAAALLAGGPAFSQTPEQQQQLAKLDAACEKAKAKKTREVEKRRAYQCTKATDKSAEECKQYWSKYGKDDPKDKSDQPDLYSDLPQCKRAARERAKYKPG